MPMTMLMQPDLVSLERAEKLVEKFGFPKKSAERWRTKYKTLRGNARNRGSECLLTFTQYIRLAKKAGLTKPAQIGKSRGQYQMSRYGDIGNYEWGNCRFITMELNIAERRSRAGITAEDDESIAIGALMRLGRTKENHPGIARLSAKLKGRTKKNDAGHARQADSLSKDFVVYSPNGKTHRGRNLREFCVKNGLTRQNMQSVCLGNASHHKGWTGRYV
jgi:hypothetical protein